ncbi:unnamed protein product, partial [Iphiclides podalirius]
MATELALALNCLDNVCGGTTRHSPAEAAAPASSAPSASLSPAPPSTIGTGGGALEHPAPHESIELLRDLSASVVQALSLPRHHSTTYRRTDIHTHSVDPIHAITSPAQTEACLTSLGRRWPNAARKCHSEHVAAPTAELARRPPKIISSQTSCTVRLTQQRSLSYAVPRTRPDQTAEALYFRSGTPCRADRLDAPHRCETQRRARVHNTP